MKVQTTTIEGHWQVAERIPAGRDIAFPQGGERDWIPAQVPGHVHLDLMRAGVIGDPFWRMQERGCRWVDEADWTYRTTFDVDAERLGAGGRHFLTFHGLDTIARVFLNGTPVGSAENFYVPHRFEVTDALRAGANDLRVEFDAALRVGQERARAYLGDGTSERGRQHYFNFAPRAFVRKAQYMFGWDWGPELVSCGVWQKVELVTVPVAEIRDWHIDYDFVDTNTVDITITAEVEQYGDAALALGASLFAPGDTVTRVPLPRGPGRHKITLSLPDVEIERWRPNAGDGRRPKRYLLNLRLFAEDVPDPRAPIDACGLTVGFRTVELVREPDADGRGEGFRFRVNGVDTFIKGANWIPDDSFPARITEEQLRERLTQARDAGYNMLRVWGGGLYESEAFYRLCDELGLLVWQDFPFACSSYPDDEAWFVEAVRTEATTAVRRIRNHPCLALWCGGNENLELHQDRWAGKAQATRFFGERLIHEVLPPVLQAEDPKTPYWPNSPYGGEKATSEDFGDSHYWNVWHSKLPGSNGDWVNYRLSESRFSSEFGFAAPAGPRAWEQATLPGDRRPDSLVSRWHDKTRKGYETYLNFIAMHFPVPETWDDLIYYGQANQAEALKCGVEHWRRRKGRCWGTLFWQINDCWPVHSWAVIDSAGEPKAAHFASKRFHAPLLLSLVLGEGTGVRAAIKAHLVNDTLAAVPGTVEIRLLAFDGEELARTAVAVAAPANAASGPVAALEVPIFATHHETDVFVHATFTTPDGVLAENFLFLAEPKDLRLPDPGLGWEVTEPRNGEAVLTVTTHRFAGYVWLYVEGLKEPADLSDNWFHLAPGQTRGVRVTNLPLDLDADALRARLRVRHL